MFLAISNALANSTNDIASFTDADANFASFVANHNACDYTQNVLINLKRATDGKRFYQLPS